MWFTLALIATLCWTCGNVLDSILVKSYEKNPRILLWYRSLTMLVLLGIFVSFASVQTPWWPWLFATGIAIYIGDFLYYRTVDRVDASVLNAIWAMLTVELSLVGLLLFAEQWSPAQSMGVVCILGGVLLLSYWNSPNSLPKTIGWFTLVAVFYVPVRALRKAALVAGHAVPAAFFWPLLCYGLLSFTLPLLNANHRQLLGNAKLRGKRIAFFMGLIVCLDLTGIYLITQAYGSGPISLISVTTNVQPFLVIAIAWLLVRFAPHYAPRELLSAQSIGTKLLCFSLVSAGLVLLALS